MMRVHDRVGIQKRFKRGLLPLALLLLMACTDVVVASPGRLEASGIPSPDRSTPVSFAGRPVDQTPTVTVTAIPMTASVGQPVTVSYQISGVGQNGFATNLVIEFNDGSPAVQVSPGQTINHVFTQAGTFRIRLTGVAANGTTVQGETSLAITPARTAGPTGPSITPAISVSNGSLPSVAISDAPATGTVGQAVSFTAATAGSPNGCGSLQYRFTFGDNTAAATGQTVTHTYTAAGTYPVTLTVTDCIGATASANSSITIGTGPAAPQGLPVEYKAGWSIVAGPAGSTITGNTGPLYTFQPGDTSYETLGPGSPLSSGRGYWAYFVSPATATIAIATPQTITAALPAGQYVMIGNPGNTPAAVSGADSVVTFDPATNGYVSTTTLAPGQGAWAVSIAGGTATIANSAR